MDEKLGMLLDEAQEDGLNVEEISLAMISEGQREIQVHLMTLWEQGKAFVSKVKVDGLAWVPAENAKWTSRRQHGYFGYHKDFGVYRLGTCDQRLRFRPLATLDMGSPVSSISISPSGTDLVVGLYSGEIMLVDLTSLTISKKISAHSKRVWSVDFSPDGRKFVSGSQDGQIKIWKSSGDELQVVTELEDWVTSVRFSPDGTMLLSGHKIADPHRAAVKVWKVDTSSLVASFTHHGTGKNVYAAEWLPDGKGFVSGGSDKRVACYLLDDDKPVFQSDIHTGTVTGLAVHPEGKWIASGAWSGTVKVWETSTGKVIRTLEAHNTRVSGLACSPSGRFLASGSRDSYLYLWGMPEGRLLGGVRAHDGWIRTLIFGGSDASLVTGGSDGYCKIWAVERYQHLRGR